MYNEDHKVLKQRGSFRRNPGMHDKLISFVTQKKKKKNGDFKK